jgi:hypothetical protein
MPTDLEFTSMRNARIRFLMPEEGGRKTAPASGLRSQIELGGFQTLPRQSGRFQLGQSGHPTCTKSRGNVSFPLGAAARQRLLYAICPPVGRRSRADK